MALDSRKIRKDYACLSAKRRGGPIYLDNACMTLKPEPVLKAMMAYYQEHPSCHLRAVHAFGEQTTKRFEGARETIKTAFNGGAEYDVLFTRNTTEAINLVASALRFREGDVVLTSDAEHNSNLLPWQFLAKKVGVIHKTFTVPPRAQFEDLTEVKQILEAGRVRLVSIMHTSHVTGMSLPVAEIARLAHEHGAVVLVDAAQALAHHRLDVKALGADFMAVSFHKAFGPTGTGGLCASKAQLQHLSTFLVGGETVEDVDYDTCALSPGPARFEAGLQDYAGMIGAAAAIDYMQGIGFEAIRAHELELNRFVTEGLAGEKKLRLVGPPAPEHRGSIVNVEVEGLDAGELSILLDQAKRIMVRTGVHCCHAWFRKNKLTPSLRFSFSVYNTQDEARTLLDTLKKLLHYF